MLRTLFLIVALAVGLSILMKVVVSMVRTVQGFLGLKGDPEAKSRAASSRSGGSTSAGHFVRDPESGTYVDESVAVKAEIGGTTYYFESEQTRDAYLRKTRS